MKKLTNEKLMSMTDAVPVTTVFLIIENYVYERELNTALNTLQRLVDLAVIPQDHENIKILKEELRHLWMTEHAAHLTLNNHAEHRADYTPQGFADNCFEWLIGRDRCPIEAEEVLVELTGCKPS